MGGGATAIIMPAIAAGIAQSGVHMFTAWRWAFFVPGGIFLIMGAISLAFGVVSEGGWKLCFKTKRLKASLLASSGHDAGCITIKCARCACCHACCCLRVGAGCPDFLALSGFV